MLNSIPEVVSLGVAVLVLVQVITDAVSEFFLSEKLLKHSQH